MDQISVTPTEIDVTVKKKFYDMVNASNLGLSSDVVKKYGTVGMMIGVTAYRHTPIDIQVLVAFYTFCVAMMDDDIMSPDDIREFPFRLCDGCPQGHPILTRFAIQLTSMYDYFVPFGATTIFASTLEFINGEMLVRDDGGPDEAVIEYADYIRSKTGLGQGYAAFMWPRSMFPSSKTYVQAFP